MEFVDYARLVLRHWIGVLSFALVGLILGAASIALATPTYQATAYMFVGNDLQGELNPSVSQFTLDRMPSYAVLANSTQVTQGVKQQLNLGLSAEAISGRISASVVPDSVVLRLDVEDVQPERTAQIANTAARRVGAAIQDLEAPLAGSSPLRVTIVRPATTPSAPVSPNRTIRLGLGLALGLGLGLLAVSLREQLARSSAGNSRRRTDPGVIDTSRPDTSRPDTSLTGAGELDPRGTWPRAAP